MASIIKLDGTGAELPLMQQMAIRSAFGEEVLTGGAIGIAESVRVGGATVYLRQWLDIRIGVNSIIQGDSKTPTTICVKRHLDSGNLIELAHFAKDGARKKQVATEDAK